MITKEIFIGMMIISMLLSAILVVAFDGLILYAKGVRLLNEKFDRISDYERFSFHVFEVTRITLFILSITGFLLYKEIIIL